MTIKDNIINALKEKQKTTFELSEIISIIDEVTSSINLPILESNGVKLNPATMEVTFKNKNVIAPKKVFELIYYFILNKNKIIRKDEILRDVWGNDVLVVYSTISVHICKARIIIGDDNLTTIKRVGYAWYEK